jgi:hypothetical protein
MLRRRLTVVMDQQERDALEVMAQTSLRPARDELRFLLRQEATRRGLLRSEKGVESAQIRNGLAEGEEVSTNVRSY